MYRTQAVEKISTLIDEIESRGLCLKDDKWQPTKEMLDILIKNAENLGVSIRKSHSSIRPEDLEPIFNKMNVWMEEIIDLKKENDIYKHTVDNKDKKISELNEENIVLKKKIEDLEKEKAENRTVTKRKTATRKRSTATTKKGETTNN